ncbi:MAG: hypothetical protein J5842_00250 [Lachnospiraceae bacterium]|nr:hypothetical protein [Lachnospiraceae bacterium]
MKNIGKLKLLRIMMLIAMCALVLSGCGKATPEKVLLKMSLKSASDDASNCKSTGEMNIDIQASQLAIKTDVTFDQESTAKPHNSHLTMTTDMGNLGKKSIEAYVMSEDSRYCVYYDNDGKWMKMYVNNEDLSGKLSELGLSTFSGFTNYSEGLQNLSMTEETLNGENVYRINADISLADAGDDVEDMINSLGLTNSSLDVSGLKNMKLNMWVYKKSYLPAKITLDMTDLMDQIMEESVKGTMAQGQVSVNTAVMTVSYSDYGKVGKITLSDEAKDARMQ